MKLTPDDVFLIVDKLPWEEFHGGQYVKSALRLLIDQNPKIRKESYFLLDNVLVVQGSLFEASLYIIPFLIALLETDVKYGRDDIFNLLDQIANGVPIDDKPVIYRIEYEPFVYFTPAVNGIEQNLRIACRGAVLMGMKTYYREILDITSNSRTNSADVIISFVEHSPLIKRFLREVIANEKNSSDIEFYTNMINEVSLW
jgi:hypothetical protein